MQVYGRGLRRRLPPMLDGDQRRMRMVYSLLFALPGTPVMFYGEEIGMGENLKVEGRFAVRTPMQWTADPGGGFSTADKGSFPAPVTTGRFGPKQVNVRAQERDPNSLLSWMRLLIESYRACPELAWGNYTVLDPGPGARPVFAHRCESESRTVLALHNLCAEPRLVPLALEGCDGSHRLVDLLQSGEAPISDEGTAEIALEGYGYRWLRVVAEDSRRLV